MASVWNKIDTGLARIYADYLRAPDRVPNRLHVRLRYTGNLAEVERAGFATIAADGRGDASGSVRLADLEAIALCDGVVSIRYGSEPALLLDKSIPQVQANLVWTQGGAPLFEFSGTTGAGVIVGVIDTGCDVRHPFLWRQTIPLVETRILRLWDHGLIATGAETSPDPALLDPLGVGSYGVEYTKAQIDAMLQGVSGAMAIRTRDCVGHGTHVASTAAGDGRFKFKFRGVAPRADLVIVKLLHPEHEPDVGGVPVGFEQRLRDAVFYIRNFADSLTRPVVINASLGPLLGPHDGFDEESQFLNDTFDDAVSAGKIYINAAGNSAGILPDPPKPPARQHARIEFVGPTTITIPFELFDTRVDFNEFNTCVAKDSTKVVAIEFWYPSGLATVSARVLFQGETTFELVPDLGDPVKSGSFGPAPGLRGFSMIHSEVPGRDGATLVVRNRLQIAVDSASFGHATGEYLVELTTDDTVTVHCWCFQYRKRQGFRIEDPVGGLPAEVIVEDRFLIDGASAAPNVIAVAAYDAEVTTLDVAQFSSRGPIVRFDGGTAPDKPDIGAPGVKIDAAKSRDIMPAKPGITIQMQGTSMACPHITGAVALLLQKKPDLKPSEVRDKLQLNALTVPAPDPEEVGAGRLDVKASVDDTP